MPQFVEQDAPGNAVNHQVVDRQHQPEALPVTLQQDGLHHAALGRIEARQRGIKRLFRRGFQIAGYGMTLHQFTGGGGFNHQLAVADPRAQRRVCRTQLFQRITQLCRLQFGRHAQENAVREATMHVARLGKPVQDRQPVDRALLHAARGLRSNGQRLHRLRHARGGVQREDLTRPQQIPVAPQGGAQPHRRNAVAAEREEIVVGADALHPQQLRHGAANQPFLLGGRLAQALRQRLLRFGQRLTVNLAVNVKRQLRHHHQDRRHHVIRQTLRQLPQQLALQRG
ncbi:Uncharacterised protein [Acinetobacter baumannii]|nr:Uncharacterised protein [Acinetobacter baumannii]